MSQAQVSQLLLQALEQFVFPLARPLLLIPLMSVRLLLLTQEEMLVVITSVP